MEDSSLPPQREFNHCLTQRCSNFNSRVCCFFTVMSNRVPSLVKPCVAFYDAGKSNGEEEQRQGVLLTEKERERKTSLSVFRGS